MIYSPSIIALHATTDISSVQKFNAAIQMLYKSGAIGQSSAIAALARRWV